MDGGHPTVVKDDDGLNASVGAINAIGIKVQSKAIPLALQGKDLLVRARTGSGKTAAFSLPLLHKILLKKASEASHAKRGIRAVVLVPTKELCDQTYRHMVELCYYCRDVINVQVS